MTDDRLREAERVFRETGAVADEARLLLERVRAGMLAPERLALAAELRHEAAVIANGGPAGPRSHSLTEVVGSLERFGKQVGVRAALVVARRNANLRAPGQATEACLAGIEAWLDCPCSAHADALRPFLRGTADREALWAVHAVLAGEGVAFELADALEGYTPSEPEAASVAAIRRTLVTWALAPHVPAARAGGSPGVALDLRIGRDGSEATLRVIHAARSLTIGENPVGGIQLGMLAFGCHVSILREGGFFELTDFASPALVYLNDGRPERRRLATGDVIGLRHFWLDVRVLDAPLDGDVQRVIDEAARLRSRPGDPARLVPAATAGNLAAMLAATQAGVGFRLAPDWNGWWNTLRDVPPSAAREAVLRLAREGFPVRALGGLPEALGSALEAGAHPDEVRAAVADALARWATGLPPG
ncbi:MAG TPA: hypothetical protein VFF73_29420 [Planctomycetota bacterium]|nr:hypothetical protein [Planctomycetota bacterium]